MVNLSVLGSCAGFHKQGIICVSAAARRPLLATASTDNTVRVWDYQKMTCATTFQATHPLATIAVHPWGTEMVVAYRESAHTYVIANELIAGQRLAASNDGFSICAYSPRGGLLACARKQVHSQPPRPSTLSLLDMSRTQREWLLSVQPCIMHDMLHSADTPSDARTHALIQNLAWEDRIKADGGGPCAGGVCVRDA